MQYFISNFGGWIGVIAAVVFGVFSLIGILNRNTKEMKEQQNDAARDLIDLLTKKVNVLEGKVDQQEKDIITLTKTVEGLRSENKTLTEVLQGRDSITQQFYKDSYNAMEVAKHNDSVSEENSRNIAKLVSLLEAALKFQPPR
jgi:Zn-dependent metalloprotease